MTVLVYIEPREGKFSKSVLELVSYGYMISNAVNTDMHVLISGEVAHDAIDVLGNFGAGEIKHINNTQPLDDSVSATVIAEMAKSVNASYVILPHNLTGRAIAPRLAVKLKAGYASAVIGAPVSFEPFSVTKKVYSGKSISKQIIKTNVKIVTLSQNTFGIIENKVQPTIEDYKFSEVTPTIEVLSTDVQSDKVLLTEAEIVVSGGRGMRGPENWQPLEELASVLGAATACSRPVSDEGWRPHHEHVGQTGKVVAPTLYFALGISGAIQHLAGINSSKVIVAVNKDPEAPIFGAADYGVVGDLQSVLPRMTEVFKKFKASH